jgi:hypothetical protein
MRTDALDNYRSGQALRTGVHGAIDMLGAAPRRRAQNDRAPIGLVKSAP